MYATRSQTEETAKLEYTAYNAQQTQHSGYLTESDFGGHAKEETTLFSVTSQPPPQPLNQSQSSQQPTTPHEQQQKQHPNHILDITLVILKVGTPIVEVPKLLCPSVVVFS